MYICNMHSAPANFPRLYKQRYVHVKIDLIFVNMTFALEKYRKIFFFSVGMVLPSPTVMCALSVTGMFYLFSS